MPAPLPLLLLLAAAGSAHALPFGGQQVVLGPSSAANSAADHPLAIHNELDPLRRACLQPPP